MMKDLFSVVISKNADGKWLAHHVPSGKKTEGSTMQEAQELMKKELGLKDDGTFEAPPTSSRFTGLAAAVAQFLEGPVSESLAFHSGYARLEAFETGVAHVRLGGGCKGCPSSQITLFNGVRDQLQGRFGEDIVKDVILAMEEN
jgi:Fe-S cluster biogenesis protein NfuA